MLYNSDKLNDNEAIRASQMFMKNTSGIMGNNVAIPKLSGLSLKDNANTTSK